MLNKCPFADTGCTADLMSYEDLQQHLELVHIPHLYETFMPLALLQLDQTKDQTTLLHPCLQHFIAIMPSDTEASPPLSERIRCDSGFAEDESQYINDEGQDGITQSTQQLLQQESFGQSVSGSRDVAAEQTTVTESLLEMEAPNASRLVDSPSFRLASIESGKSCGHLVWKIEPYTEHKATATSMLSAPFYSCRYGYKMCLRLYIMGDGIGKGTHLSLFFVVMRGEFDNILQWPFTHKVTFKLINQTGGSDIVDTFKPHVIKPSQDNDSINNASGCPCFISHSELEQGGFIVDDMIFIKCSIDTSTINHP